MSVHQMKERILGLIVRPSGRTRIGFEHLRLQIQNLKFNEGELELVEKHVRAEIARREEETERKRAERQADNYD